MKTNEHTPSDYSYSPWVDDCEHDDYMTADDYDARRYDRDGWGDSRYDRQRY
jgi:hypothetical protein